MKANKGFVKKLILTAGNDDADRRLDRILRKALPDIPLSALHRLLRKGRILVNGKPAKGEDRIPDGALIELPLKETEVPHVQIKPVLENQPQLKKTAAIDILWEGEGLLIVNKPAGLTIHGGNGSPDNLESRVQAYLEGKLPASLSFKPGPLHRLDKPASGVVVFAYNLEAARWFSALLRERKIRKSYLAILEGELKKSETWEDTLTRDTNVQKTFVSCSSTICTPGIDRNANQQPRPEGTGYVGSDRNGLYAGLTPLKHNLEFSQTAPRGGVLNPLANKNKYAHTGITPLARAKKNGAAYTLARLEITTGRTHQIRAQAAHHGYPLAGDSKYGVPDKDFSPGKRVWPNKGFFLHASELELPNEPQINPKVPRIIRAPLPEQFAMTIIELFGTIDV
ncbi:MAG: RluA family pseudouridine synthase [Treponema sp.]|nr:RluA family pseudouridine synthase [Treponema sp.]